MTPPLAGFNRGRKLPIWARYGLTTAIVGMALALRFAMNTQLENYPFLLFIPAILLSALLFDRGSGLFATALSAITSAYFFLKPAYSFALSAEDFTALALFVVICIAAVLVIEALHTALHELAEANAELTVSQARLAAAEQQKDLMLREMTHRIRNDLQMLISLLQLQRRNAHNPAAHEALGHAIERLHVMSRVHHRLTQEKGEALVDAYDFIGGLCNDLKLSSADARSILLNVKVEPHRMPLARALPLGLIVNELITNALKHAFPDGRFGTITVSYRHNCDGFVLTVEDDGVGAGAHPDDGQVGGDGRQLVRGLAHQLGATIDITHTSEGTRCVVHRRANLAKAVSSSRPSAPA